VPPTPYRPDDLRRTLFRGSTVVRAGRLTEKQLRSSAWRRLFPDVYACATVHPTHEVRAVAAARLLLPDAVVSGRSAAVLWGVPLAGPDDPVEVTLPPQSRAGSVQGIRARRRALDPSDSTSRRGVRLTTPVRTALDLAALRPVEEAVIALDRFVAAGVVALGTVRDAASGLTGRNCRYVRTVAGLADGLAGSPQETRLRLLLHRSALPHPVAQFSVRMAGRFLARVDFAWPEQKLAVEYEGLWHGEHQQVARDRARLNRLTAAGWRVIFVTARDLRRPDALVARIAAALAQ
jgi:hypothetical protein